MSSKEKGLKLNYGKTFLIGFGFFASSIAWAVYNANVPLILKEYIDSAMIVGMIMSIDNVFAVIFQPLFGAISDKTNTRYGKRMPYILLGIPLCAILFSFIPFTPNLVLLMTVIIVFNFIMSIWRAPVVALMPDMTHPALRSKANGVINLMGGVGGVMAFLIGGILIKNFGMTSPFVFSTIVMIIAWLLLFFFVKEPEVLTKEERIQVEEKEKAEEKENKKSINKSLICILLAIFFWFVGYNAVETFFTTYALEEGLKSSGQIEIIEKMNMKSDEPEFQLTKQEEEIVKNIQGDGSITLSVFSLALVIGAIPAGIIGTKFGRKKTIMVGIVGIMVLFALQIIINDLFVAKFLLGMAGLCWALININSLPMVLEIAKSSRIGKYTGFYYFFSMSAAIISPTLAGYICDLTKNYGVIFIYAVVAFGWALIFISMAKHGEAEINQEEINMEIENMQD